MDRDCGGYIKKQEGEGREGRRGTGMERVGCTQRDRLEDWRRYISRKRVWSLYWAHKP